MGDPNKDPGVVLSEKDWLDRLVDPRFPVKVNFRNTPFRMQTPPRWDTGEQRISEHLLYFVAESRCTAILDGKKFLASAGSLSWVSPGVPYRFAVREGEAPPLICRFRFSLGARGELRLVDNFRFIPEAWRLFEGLKQIAWEAERPGPYAETRMKNLFSLFSIEVFCSGESPDGSGAILSATQRNRIAEAAPDYLAGKIRPADLARKIGLTPDYFSRVFRKTYGEPPRTWLLKQKLDYAAALLRESSAGVSEIAERLGYNELYLFSRQFREHHGVSPRRWRQMG